MKIFNRLFYSLALITFIAGFFLPIDKYIVPRTGIGFYLGISGCTAMLLAILIYSVPRRMNWFKSPVAVQSAFNAHRVLGVLGPIAVLYHCGYHLGAPNSNMALYAMVAVVIAGLVTMLLTLIPTIDKYTKWWRMVHIPATFFLVITAIVHVMAFIVY
jgi:hypothetical protein